MYIKRDWSRPFFGKRRRTGLPGLLLAYVAFVGTLLLVVHLQFDRLQLVALDAVGLAPTPTPFASTLATDGYNRWITGDAPGAMSLYERAVAQQPSNVSYLYEYGRTLIELERAADAVPIADRAIAADPADPRGYALKAHALIWAGNSAAAIPAGVSGLEVDPEYAPLHSALARAYTNIGRYQQGVSSGERAITLDPMDADAHRSFAYALIWVGRREEAMERLETAVSINPNRVVPYFELALIYLSLDRDARAIATYERVLSLQPSNAKAYLRLCEAYSKIGQDAQAQGYCTDALRIQTDYPQAWRQLGMVQYRRRNYESAIESFRRCVDNGSTEIECWYLRGLAHYYLGQCDDAWSLLGDALTMTERYADNALLVTNIQEGLRLTTVSCSSYAGRALPTAPPPTPIPPTPIGSF